MRVLILIFCAIFVFGLENSAPKFLLQSYKNPNRLAFRLNRGVFECSLLGVAVPFYGNNECVNENFKKMSNLSKGFFRDNLNLEQMYSLNIINGFCVVSYANINFNEEVILKGFGVVNPAGADSEILERLNYLQELAQKNKVGLWRDFYDEMECFSRSY